MMTGRYPRSPHTDCSTTPAANMSRENFLRQRNRIPIFRLTRCANCPRAPGRPYVLLHPQCKQNGATYVGHLLRHPWNTCPSNATSKHTKIRPHTPPARDRRRPPNPFGTSASQWARKKNQRPYERLAVTWALVIYPYSIGADCSNDDTRI